MSGLVIVVVAYTHLKRCAVFNQIIVINHLDSYLLYYHLSVARALLTSDKVPWTDTSKVDIWT